MVSIKLHSFIYMLTTFCFGAIMFSCSDNDGELQKGTEENKTIAILETDIGSSADDLIAMEKLYAADDMGIIDFKAIMVNREGMQNLKMVDIMNTYYKHTDILIGTVRDGVKNPNIFIDYWKMALPENYTDEPVFNRTLTDGQLNDLPVAEDLYRKLLSEAPDTSVVIFSVGFATNLSKLLQTKADNHSALNGTELVKKKVKALYIQAGHFGNAMEPDYNFNQDPKNAYILMDKWPTEIWFSPQETGDKFDYTPEMVLADLDEAGLTDSPIYHTYKHHDCNTGQRMWDVCAVMQFLHPECFSVKGPMHYSIDENMILHEKQGSLHYMTYTDTEEQNELIMKYIRKCYVPK